MLSARGLGIVVFLQRDAELPALLPVNAAMKGDAEGLGIQTRCAELNGSVVLQLKWLAVFPR